MNDTPREMDDSPDPMCSDAAERKIAMMRALGARLVKPRGKRGIVNARMKQGRKPKVRKPKDPIAS